MTTAELKVQALELRKAGYTLPQIGEVVGRDKSRVSRWIKAALDKLADEEIENASELRVLLVEQARMAMFAIQKQVLAGDLGAISQWRQLIETIGRLGGLMSPDVATFVGAAIEIHMHRLPDNDAPGDGEAPKELALAELEDRPAPLSAPDGEVAP